MAVACAVHSSDFRGGRRSVDGGPWALLGQQHWVNPRFKLPDWALDMIRLWRLYQGGMGGAGHLPDAGGSMDQAAIMLDAFGVMCAAEADLKPEG